MSLAKKTLMVAAIENGTVIDHVPAGQALKIIELLKIENTEYPVTVGLNLESKRIGRKDILKIEGRFLTEVEAGEIAVFAPGARINIIRDFEVIDKMTAELPTTLARILVCPNANCITHTEAIDSLFRVRATRGEIQLTCHYCEGVFLRDAIAEYRT